MTKNELIMKYEGLLEKQGLACLHGISRTSNKTDLINAIECLECTDEEMDAHMAIVQLKYANIHRVIMENSTNFKRHHSNRIFVFDTAKLCLALKST